MHFKSKLKTSSKFLREFFSTISFHGFAFLFHPETHWFGRIYWFACIAGSLSVGAYFSYIITVSNADTEVGYSETPIPVSEVAFPSLTFCPNNAILASDIDKTYGSDATCVRNSDTGEVSWQVCDLQKFKCRDMANTTMANISYAELYNKMNKGLHNTVLHCLIESFEFDCRPYFRDVITSKGICYNFFTEFSLKILKANVKGLNGTESFVKLYGKRIGKKVNKKVLKMLRTLKSQLKIKFILAIPNRADQCEPTFRGFYVSLRAPHDMPSITTTDPKLLAGKHTQIEVVPLVKTASKDILPFERTCHLKDEIELKYFWIFTDKNCALECAANAIFANCSCASYDSPSKLGFEKDDQTDWISTGLNTTRVCTLMDSPCVENILEQIPRQENIRHNLNRCSCLGCEQLSYLYNVYYYGLTRSDKALLEKDNLSFNDVAMVSIFTRKRSVLSLHHSPRFEVIQIVANHGGLLGLFLGVSLLAPAEIIYLCIIRPLCRRRRLNKVDTTKKHEPKVARD